MGDERAAWDARPALMALLGAGAGLAVELITDVGSLHPGRLALALFVATFAVLLAFTVERERAHWSLGFAAVVATLVGWITWRSVPSGSWDSGTVWRMTCAFLAVAIAAPLFQTTRDEGAEHFPYATSTVTHERTWCCGERAGALRGSSSRSAG